jgi:hypothetical protein
MYISKNIRVIKPRGMRSAGHVACRGELRNAYKVWSENLKGRPFGRPGVEGRIILEWIRMKFGGEVWTGLIWLRIETSGGPL